MDIHLPWIISQKSEACCAGAVSAPTVESSCAEKRQVAISPVAAIPHKTLFHELAHIELGHTAETSFTDSERTPRSLREAEAEAVALLLCESLELPGAEFARGYIQSWLRGDVIPEKSAQKIFGAADRILKAGQAGKGSLVAE